MDDQSELADRLAALEARVARLEVPRSDTTRSTADATVLDRLRAIEGRGRYQ